MNSNFYLYYQLNNGDVKYIKSTGEISTFSKQSPKARHRYAVKYLEVKDQKEITDIDLQNHLVKFNTWMKEIRDNKIQRLLYTEYYHTDFGAVCGLFNKYVKYKDHDRIRGTEYMCMEKVSNGALFYMNEKYINKPTQCYSYDKKLFYVNVFVSDVKIPTKAGNWTKLNKLPLRSKDLRYGFYHVKITAKNKDFNKVFSYSKYDMYLDISLRRAMHLRKKFDITIELVDDGKDNAYLYEDKDMVYLKDLSHKWHEKVTKLRAEFKQNPYVKFLGNTAWSSMNKRVTKRVTEEELDELDVTSHLDYESEYKLIKTKINFKGEKTYEVLKTEYPYKYNIRLKSWIAAQARDIMCEIALKHIDKIVRIQTDSITFTEPIENDDPLFVVEENTTGVMIWENGNRYTNTTTGYKTKNIKDSEELEEHE